MEETYRVMIGDQKFIEIAPSPAVAHRLARDARNAKLLDTYLKFDNEKQREKFFRAHQDEIRGPDTAVVQLMDRHREG